MLTTKQRVDKVKEWIRQSCNRDDVFNVATVYDEVEGVSVRDCTKCSFSCSPGSASGVMVSVSQLYCNQNQVQQNSINKTTAVEKGEVTEKLESKINVEKGVEPENLENKTAVENREVTENLENKFVGNRRKGKEVRYFESCHVKFRKIVENQEELKYPGNKSVGDGKEVENTSTKKMANSGENFSKNVDDSKLDTRVEEISEDGELVENGEKLIRNNGISGNLEDRKVVEYQEDREVVQYQEEFSVKKVKKLQETQKKSRKKLKKNGGRRIFVEEEEVMKKTGGERNGGIQEEGKKGGGEGEVEENVGKDVEEDVEKNVEGEGEIGDEEGGDGRVIKGGGEAKVRSKRNSGGGRQPKKNYSKGGDRAKSNFERKENSDKSSSSQKTRKNRRNVDNDQENGEEREEENLEERGGEEGREEEERKDEIENDEDVMRMEENVQTNREKDKNAGKKRFKISSQGMRVYINKKKPSWKKFIRTPCLTWATDRTVEQSKRRRKATDKRLKELNKFIANLDFEGQAKRGEKKGWRKRNRSKEEVETICTPQENGREEEGEDGEEKSSDTDWDDRKNIDLRKTFVKNRHRFRDRYTDCLHRPEEFEITPKEDKEGNKGKEEEKAPKKNLRKLGKRRRLLDCYSVWDEEEVKNKHKKELGKMMNARKKKLEIRLFDDGEESYNFGNFSVDSGKVLEDLFKKEKTEEEGKTTKKRMEEEGKIAKKITEEDGKIAKKRRRGKGGAEKESGKGSEEDAKENRGIGRKQENGGMEENFENLDQMRNTNFEVRIGGGVRFENKQIVDDPLLDAEGYLTGFGFLETTENENLVLNCVENNNSKVLSGTVHAGEDRAVVLDGSVQYKNLPLDKDGNNIPVISSKTVQFEDEFHENSHRNITAELKNDKNSTPLELNDVNTTVNKLHNISVQYKNVGHENISKETVQNEKSNERNSISEAVNDGMKTMSGRITHNGGLDCENSKISSNKKSQAPELRIVLTRCDDLVEKMNEDRKEKEKRVGNRNEDVIDREGIINEMVIEKRNKIFVTKSKTTSKQEKFLEKYISSIKKASTRARKYRKLKVQVVKSENLNKSCEKTSVYTEKTVEKKFNMTKFCRKSLSGSSGWSDIDERLKQIDVKRSYVKLKVVKNCEKVGESSENREKIRENFEKSGENCVRNGKNQERDDTTYENSLRSEKNRKREDKTNEKIVKTHESRRKLSKNIGRKPGERKKLFDLEVEKNQSTKSDVKRKQNVLSKQNNKKEDEPERKLAKVDFTEEQHEILERMDEEDKENRRNVEEEGGRKNGNCGRMVDKENRMKLGEKGDKNTVKMSKEVLKDITNTRNDFEKVVKNKENVRRVEDNVKNNLCEKNSSQENILKEIANNKGIDNNNILITKEYSKHRVEPTEAVNENSHVNNYENNEIVGENLIKENVGKAGELIEIIPDSLDLEGQEMVNKDVEKSNENHEINPGNLDVVIKNIAESNVNIEIIPESLDLVDQGILDKNVEKSNVNIGIIPESLDLVDEEKLDENLKKSNVHIETIDKNIETISENLNSKGDEHGNGIIARIVNENTGLNRETPSKAEDKNLEMIGNCINLEEKIVESGDWFVENSAPLDDEKNFTSILRLEKASRLKFCNKIVMNEEDSTCKNTSKVRENLKSNDDEIVKNCGELKDIEGLSKNNEEIDNFGRNIDQKSNAGLEENVNISNFKQNTQLKLVEHGRVVEEKTNNKIEVNNNPSSVHRRFKSTGNHSYASSKNCAKNNESEIININRRHNHGLENNGTVDSCMENGADKNHETNKYGLENNKKEYHCSTKSCEADENRKVGNYGISNKLGTNNTHETNNGCGTNNDFGTNSTCGTSNYHKNSCNSINIYEKLLQEDEEFFTNENLLTIDGSLNNMDEDIQFNELEIQLEGQLIGEFCEMLQDLEDDERFDRNLLKSFVRRLRGAPVRRLAFDTRGNVLVDGVRVVPDFEENRTFSGENVNFCSKDEENLMDDCEELVQTTPTQQRSENLKDNSKKLTKIDSTSRGCPDSRILSEDSSKIDHILTQKHGSNATSYKDSTKIPQKYSSNVNSCTGNKSFNTEKYRNSQILSQNSVSTASNPIILNSVPTCDKQKVFSLIESRLQSGNESFKSSEINRNCGEIQQVPFVFSGMLSTRVLGEMSRIKMMKFPK